MKQRFVREPSRSGSTDGDCSCWPGAS